MAVFFAGMFGLHENNKVKFLKRPHFLHVSRYICFCKCTLMKKELSLVHNYAPPSQEFSHGRRNPLLVMAHGYGSDQYDLFSLAGELPGVFHVVAPRAPIELPFGGAAWYSLNFDDSRKFTHVPEALAAREKLASFIKEAAEAYDADPENVWLLGFSQGAILSYGIMSKYPRLVKYYIPLSGYIEPNIIEPVGDTADYAGIKAIATHGTQDQVIPVAWGRSVKDFMKERLVEYCYYEYPIGHGISPEGFQQVKWWVDENLI